jgi:hypothetical protein
MVSLVGIHKYANNRCWNSQNPHVTHEVLLRPVKVGVWCALSTRRISNDVFLRHIVFFNIHKLYLQSTRYILLYSIFTTCFDLMWSSSGITYLYNHLDIGFYFGRAIAEAVSRWLPTAAARVCARVWQVVFVVDKVASGQVFAEYFDFPCQNRSFHQLLHHHNHLGQSRRGFARSWESFMEADKSQNWAVEPQEKMDSTFPTLARVYMWRRCQRICMPFVKICFI